VVISTNEKYIGNLKPDDNTETDFEIYTNSSKKAIELPFEITYSDQFGRNHKENATIIIPLYSQEEIAAFELDKKQENGMIYYLVGGIILIFIDKWIVNNKEDTIEIPNMTALKVGFFQCLAMIPGVSRSAATIIGGMTQKMSRKAAAEFSFFLAVPTMFAASSYKLLSQYKSITEESITLLIIGNIVGFLVAMGAIKFFISFLTKYGFKFFGYYRIILGITILVLLYFGYDLKVD
ncbi:MAG: undecaprenyl-diphosphate phosphatase, partial [Cytophagaceae bacterium]